MYDHGNYPPQYGQSPNRLPRPPFTQQGSYPPAPGGLLHQGPHGVIPRAGQHPHVVSPGASAYHSTPIAQSCSSSSMPGTGQSYLPQPPAGNNSTPLMHPYPVIQQGAQSAQFFPALPPPPPGHSRVPPPLPSQSQNLYRGPVHQPSPGMQQMITTLPPPPPPMPLQSSNLPSRSPFHSVAPSTSEGSHISSVAFQQPPLPPSPPPLPPPPPSSNPQSSLSLFSSQPMNYDPSVQSLFDPGSIQTVKSESVENTLTHDRNRENAPNDGSGCEMETKTIGVSASKGGMSSVQSDNIDVHTAPPRPADEKTLRNVEILCQFISKNGLAFEDMVRQKKAGNSEFSFLYGGEPGSEAAIAHKYYLWMKNGLVLGQNQSNSLLKGKHEVSKSLVEPNSLNATSCSLSDSDMDMEDDIIQHGGNLAVNDKVSGLKQDFVSAAGGNVRQEEDNSLQSAQGGILTIRLGPPIKSEGDDEGASSKTPGSVTHSEDPINLLKGYASDDTSEDDAHLGAFGGHEPTSTFQCQEAVIITSDGCKMQDRSESKASELGYSASHMRNQPKDLDADPAIKISVNEVNTGPSTLEKKVEKTVENYLKADASKQSHKRAEKDAWESSGACVVSESGKAQREHKKRAIPVKVDEFGRLMREGDSETHSDDSSYYRRRGRRRGRSRSTSRSPPLRKRRRKSPRRAKERRSLSRSLSPKRRRSRSRSPFRRAIDIGSNKTTRGRPQMGECFNYIKGRCYRGASCKYLHSDPYKNSESRHYRSKQHASETRASTSDYDYSEENKVTTTKGSQEYDLSSEEMHHDKVTDGEIKPYKKQHANSDYALKGATAVKDTFECGDSSVHDGLLGRDGSVAVIGTNDDAIPEVSSSCLLRTSDSKDVSDPFSSILKNDDKSGQPVSLGKDEHGDHSQSESLTQEHGAHDNQSWHLRGSSPTSTVQIPPVSFCQPSEDVLSQCKNPAEPMGQRDMLASDSPAIDYPYHVSQLPPPPPLSLQPPFLHVASIPCAPQSVPYPSVLSSNQHAQYHTPQNQSWSTFPTPRPTYMVTPPIHGGPTSFQQLSLISDLSMQPSLKTNPTDRLIHPRIGSLQEQTYMSMQGSHQPPPHVDAVHPGNLLGHSITGSIAVRDDRYVNPLPSGPFPSSSFPHGNIPPRPASSLGEANTNKVKSFSHGTLPSGEPSRPDFQIPPYLQQHPSYGLYQAAGDSFREPLSYSVELQRNHPAHISDTGSMITAHHNPFASTFDQPLGSKFSSDGFRQEKRPYGSEHENSFSLVCASFECQKVNYGASPVNSSKAGGQTLPNSGGDQYDPLFDSIEPSAESLKKLSAQEDHAADNSDIMLRLSGSKPSDAKVNRRKKELGVVAAATSSENDEFGETAHAEEGGSRSNSYDGAEGAACDVEIDQVKREGQSKKSKDSRSMKFFKVELASFVKDMLKPSWRQGNMSKEAFKTIVKKTVEKVSGAMKGHRVPKSKAKIEQYIDRSQRKLTTLVEGYVNKYAKA